MYYAFFGKGGGGEDIFNYFKNDSYISVLH